MKNTGRIALMLTIAFCALLWNTTLLAQEQIYTIRKGESLCVVAVRTWGACTEKNLGHLLSLNPELGPATAQALLRGKRTMNIIVHPGQQIRTVAIAFAITRNADLSTATEQMKRFDDSLKELEALMKERRAPPSNGMQNEVVIFLALGLFGVVLLSALLTYILVRNHLYPLYDKNTALRVELASASATNIAQRATMERLRGEMVDQGEKLDLVEATYRHVADVVDGFKAVADRSKKAEADALKTLELERQSLRTREETLAENQRALEQRKRLMTLSPEEMVALAKEMRTVSAMEVLVRKGAAGLNLALGVLNDEIVTAAAEKLLHTRTHTQKGSPYTASDFGALLRTTLADLTKPAKDILSAVRKAKNTTLMQDALRLIGSALKENQFLPATNRLLPEEALKLMVRFAETATAAQSLTDREEKFLKRMVARRNNCSLSDLFLQIQALWDETAESAQQKTHQTEVSKYAALHHESTPKQGAVVAG
ncbi:MAG: hypothetical protein A3D67_04520 [Candidatus Lloydbacteria bacterium RIFCSPHIGHO2_02_FULL_51_22]|uniref:LysM domain-containing protein n=2 Tax=Candidatus Lloydiibacteriota TaxID=1817910 RepID=A0A1G2D7K2_9BACT|nr:MAG: hypothetical protein A3D67_04520 [Candidatus Lloydbacteria bacterium RIFCSPHIGHO2_02_FULL_51_22]OGZ15643.1 MAG: hypothetical protein A3J08_00410 [Candidatus Lloydbacteria bacterium RIFCSPLOWO2_02_FULL_51_11]